MFNEYGSVQYTKIVQGDQRSLLLLISIALKCQTLKKEKEEKKKQLCGFTCATSVVIDNHTRQDD